MNTEHDLDAQQLIAMEHQFFQKHGYRLYDNLVYRENGVISALRQTVEPSIRSVAGRTGADAEAPDSNLKNVELKSVNAPSTIWFTKSGRPSKGHCGSGHQIANTRLAFKLDKLRCPNRRASIKTYDGFALSVYADGHYFPEMIFYIKDTQAVRKIHQIIDSKIEKVLSITDRGINSFAASTISVTYNEVLQACENDEINIIIKQNYITPNTSGFVTISKDEYLTKIVGREVPVGNFKYYNNGIVK